MHLLQSRTKRKTPVCPFSFFQFLFLFSCLDLLIYLALQKENIMHCIEWTGFVFRYPSYHHLTYLKWTVLTTANPKKTITLWYFQYFYLFFDWGLICHWDPQRVTQSYKYWWFARGNKQPWCPFELTAAAFRRRVSVWDELHAGLTPHHFRGFSATAAPTTWLPTRRVSPLPLFTGCDMWEGIISGLPPATISCFYTIPYQRGLSRMGAGASNWEKVYSHPPEKQIAPW